MSNIPITTGSGQASVAAETVSGISYQQIQVLGQGGSSVLSIDPAGAMRVSVVGSPYVFIAGSVAAVTASTSNQSVSGTVGASVIGKVPIETSNSSIITYFQNSSVLAFPQGSMISAGTYAADSSHANTDRGFFNLNVRNDTLASVTSSDNDYSAQTVGPAGEAIAVDAPFTKWISGVADLRVVQGASIVVMPPQGASIFTYIREVQVSNFGPSSVLVKIGGGLGSTLGWTIAPAGGGSNYTTRLKTGENSAVTASINGTASVLVTLSGFISKT